MSVVSFLLWTYTFKEFKEGQKIAEVFVSKQVIVDGKPTFSVTIKENDQIAGWNILSTDNKQKETNAMTLNLSGDQVTLVADYIEWNGYLKFINFKPVYKITKVSTSLDSVEINGGTDWFKQKLEAKPNKFKYLARGKDVSSETIKVSNEDKSYIITLANGKPAVEEN